MRLMTEYRSTAEQEAVATWPSRHTQPKGFSSVALLARLTINRPDSRVESDESARSLPLPVLRLSDIILIVQSRHIIERTKVQSVRVRHVVRGPGNVRQTECHRPPDRL